MSNSNLRFEINSSIIFSVTYSYSSIVVLALMTKILDAVGLNMVRGTKIHQEWGMKELLEAFHEELEIRKKHVSIFTGKESRGTQAATKERNDFKTRSSPSTTSAFFTKHNSGRTKWRS